MREQNGLIPARNLGTGPAAMWRGGGTAQWPDLAIDPQGNAIVIWQQDDGTRSDIAMSRFDAATGEWQPAVLAETEPGNAAAVRASADGGQALLAWLQREGQLFVSVQVALREMAFPNSVGGTGRSAGRVSRDRSTLIPEVRL